MTDAQRRRMEKFDREKVFMNDNAADFPADSPADKVSNQIYTKMDEVLCARCRSDAGTRRTPRRAGSQGRFARSAARSSARFCDRRRRHRRRSAGHHGAVQSAGKPQRPESDRRRDRLFRCFTAAYCQICRCRNFKCRPQ